ncbi:MAG: tetratricopeptide repeat protein [Allosphingosinicella sp.]
MTLRYVLLAASLAASAGPAAAAVTVLGNSSARMCYQAADAVSLPSADMLDRCDTALREDSMSRYDMVATLVNRGIIRMRLGSLAPAIQDFDAAIARDPNQAEAYLNKGMALLKQPQGYSAALPLFSTALEKRTRRPAVAYYGRAVANELGGHVREAYFDYREASRIEPKWREPQVELARFSVHERQ